jgi:hypothetical protein
MPNSFASNYSTALDFPRTCKQLETYLGMTGEFRHYIEDYTHKAAPLHERKKALMKDSPTKGAPRRAWSARSVLNNPPEDELRPTGTPANILYDLLSRQYHIL